MRMTMTKRPRTFGLEHSMIMRKSNRVWGAVGFFKDDRLKKKFDEENNTLVQVEYLDTKTGKVRKRMLELFDRGEKRLW